MSESNDYLRGMRDGMRDAAAICAARNDGEVAIDDFDNGWVAANNGCHRDILEAVAKHNNPVDDAAAKVLEITRKFIADNRIACSETIHQTDLVIENAYDLIQQLCDVAGYHEEDN